MKNENVSYQNEAIKELESGFEAILPDGYEGFADIESLSGIGIDSLLHELSGALNDGSGELSSFLLAVMGVSVVLALSSRFSSPISSSVRGGVLAVSCLSIFIALYPIFLSTTAALADIGSFFTALSPLLTSYLALGGGSATAVSAASGLGITVWLTGLLGGGMLIPTVSALFVNASLAGSLGGVSERLGDSITHGFKRLIGALGAVVAGVFGLQTYISVAADSATMRAAKYAAGSLVPIVGSAVSGALSTLAGGLSLLGGTMGAASVAVIVSMSLSPLVMLLLYKLIVYLATLFLELSGSRAEASCMAGFGGALDALISVHVMTIIVYIFEIILLVKGGKNIFG